MSMLKFTAKSRSENPTKTIVETGGFTLTIDEPVELGGTNHGANPVQFVLAALSGCLNVVGHIVAKEMGFELKGLEFELEGELNPAKFAGQPTDERAGYASITVKVTPDTTADKATLDKWLETIESRCPVSDNLANPTPVKIVLC